MVKLNLKNRTTDFQIASPDAKSVSLVGDFNAWKETVHPMKKDRNGNWKAAIELPEGEYQFRYLIDETKWSNDEALPRVPNIFGSVNSLVDVHFSTPTMSNKEG